MDIRRAIEILDPEHRELYYEREGGLEEVTEACRMGMEALKAQLAADDAPPRQAGNFCQFCGKRLRVIGTERFCNNVNCQNRYINV